MAATQAYGPVAAAFCGFESLTLERIALEYGLRCTGPSLISVEQRVNAKESPANAEANRLQEGVDGWKRNEERLARLFKSNCHR